MPRSARIDAPDLVQHVIARGIEKRRIFIDDADRSHFVWRLGVVLAECSMACMGWALMPNHVHLVLRTGPVALSTAMARLLTGYAVYFNRQHARVGHLFQNRYRSIPVESEEYLMALIRYVHRNPLRAGLVQGLAELSRYPWTGYATLMGERTVPFQSVGEILERFGSSPAEARTRLAKWMEVDDSPAATRPASSSPAQDDEAVDHLQVLVCRELGLDPRSLRSRRRGVAADARAAIAYLGCGALGCSEDEVARALGLSVRAIQRAVLRGTEVVEATPALAQMCQSLPGVPPFTSSRFKNVP